jgi:hypothetical protein
MIDTVTLSSASRRQDISMAYRVLRPVELGKETPKRLSRTELFPDD